MPNPKPDGGAKKPTGSLDPGKTYRAVLKTSCGDITIAARPEDLAEDGRLVRLARQAGLLRRHRLPPHRAGLRDPGRRPDRPAAPAAPATRCATSRRRTRPTRRGSSRWRRPRRSRPGPPAASSTSSPPPDAGLPPDYAVLGEVVKGLDVALAIEPARRPRQRRGRHTASDRRAREGDASVSPERGDQRRLRRRRGGVRAARDRALLAAAGGGRLLGRLVRALQAAHAGAGAGGRPRARARSSWPRSTSTANQQLQAAFRIQGIPAVKAFRDGRCRLRVHRCAAARRGRALLRLARALGGGRARRRAATRSRCGARSRSTRTTRPPAASSASCCSSAARATRRSSCSNRCRGDFVADGLVARARLQGDAELAGGLRGLGRGRPRDRARAPAGGARRPGAARPRPARDGRDLHRARARRARSRASTAAACRRR